MHECQSILLKKSVCYPRDMKLKMEMARAWLYYVLLSTSYSSSEETFEAKLQDVSQLWPSETCESIIISTKIEGKYPINCTSSTNCSKRNVLGKRLFREDFDKILGCPRTIRKVEPNNVSNPWAHSMPCDNSWDQHHRGHISTGWFSHGYQSTEKTSSSDWYWPGFKYSFEVKT